VTLGMHLCSTCNRRTTNAPDDDDDDNGDDDDLICFPHAAKSTPQMLPTSQTPQQQNLDNLLIDWSLTALSAQ